MAKKTAQHVNPPETTLAKMPARTEQQQKHRPQTAEVEEQAAGLMFLDTDSGAMMDNVTRSLETNPPSSTLNFPIQTQLTLGAIGDRYEQEADRVAADTVNVLHKPLNPPEVGEAEQSDRIQRSPQVQTFQQIHSLLQRDEEGTVSNEIESNINSMRGTGSGLPGRDRFEQTMGADFSNVRVHQNAKSDQLNRQLSSRAFTTGSDIFFKQGEFKPQTPQGDELLAHELTHIKQQNPDINLKPVEQTAASQVSLAAEDTIQRNLITDFAAVKEAGRHKRLFWKKESGTMELLEKLLVGFEGNRDDTERYLYLEKAYQLLVYKHDKYTEQGLGTAINEFRQDKGFDATVENERKLYEYWLEQSLQGNEEESDESLPRNHHEAIKKLIAENTTDVPDRQLGKEYDKFVGTGKSEFKIKTLNRSELAGKALEFRKATKKSLHFRGELLSEVDRQLMENEKYFQEAEAKESTNEEEARAAYQRAIAYLNMAIDLLDIWLLKYEKEVTWNNETGDIESDNSPGGIYNVVVGYRNDFAKMVSRQASRKGISAKSTLPGIGVGATDEDTLARLRYEHVLKKYGNRYKGECGLFFGKIYPSIINMLVPSVGQKSKFEMDCLFPIWGAAGLGFHLKVDAERKDEKELKNFVDLIFHAGASGGIGKIVGGIGMYFEMVANSAKKIGQMFSYSLYRRFRESSVIPHEVTDFLWGGGGSGSKDNAEAWAMGVEEGVFGVQDDPSKKAYAESGFAARLAGEAGDDMALAAEFAALGGLGKRYSQESLVFTEGMIPVNIDDEPVIDPSTSEVVKDPTWKHADVKKKEDYDAKNKKNKDNLDWQKLELTQQEQENYKKYKIVRFISNPSEEKKDSNKSSQQRGGHKTKGQNSGRFEVETKFALGEIGEVAVKPKFEWVEILPGFHPFQNLRKAEVELKLKGKAVVGSAALATALVGAGGAIAAAGEGVARKASATNKKAMEQETDDGGHAANSVGGFFQGLTRAVVALGEAIQIKSLSGDVFSVENGGRFRLKLGIESKNIAQQLAKPEKWMDKSKGEFHVETLMKTKLGVNSISTIEAEFAARLFSFKWEGKSGWSGLAGIPTGAGLLGGLGGVGNKRVELGFGAYTKGKKRSPDEDPAESRKLLVEKILAIIGKNVFSKVYQANDIALALTSSPEQKVDLWKQAITLAASQVKPKMQNCIPPNLTGEKWLDALVKAMETYTKAPQNYLLDKSGKLDGIFCKGLIETALGKEKIRAKIHSEIFNDAENAPNLALCYNSESYDELEAIHEASLKFRAASKFMKAMQARYVPPILPPPPLPRNVSNDSLDDHTQDLVAPLPRQIVDVNIGVPSPAPEMDDDSVDIPPPPRITLGTAFKLVAKQIPDMENLFISATADSLGSLSAVENFPGEGALEDFGEGFGEIVRGTILTIPNSALGSPDSVRSYIESSNLFESLLRNDTLLRNFYDASLDEASPDVVDSLQNETKLFKILAMIDDLHDVLALFETAVKFEKIMSPEPQLSLDEAFGEAGSSVRNMVRIFNSVGASAVASPSLYEDGRFPGEEVLKGHGQFGKLIREALLSIPESSLGSIGDARAYLKTNNVFDELVLRKDPDIKKFYDASFDEARDQDLADLQAPGVLREILDNITWLEAIVEKFADEVEKVQLSKLKAKQLADEAIGTELQPIGNSKPQKGSTLERYQQLKNEGKL